MHKFFATAARGTESSLEHELRELGGERVQAVPHGVQFEANLATAYEACIASRVAIRVLLEIADFPVSDQESLYAGARALEWEAHLDCDTSFAVSATATSSAAVSHEGYVLRRVKDAIVDRFRELQGQRPSVDPDAPDLRIHAHIDRHRGRLSIDLAGVGLHRRGYRIDEAMDEAAHERAPIKENVAAGLLMRAGWRVGDHADEAFVDPMCGGGTFVLEAAMMALDHAPGLGRARFGFHGWKGHDERLWAEVVARAESRSKLVSGERPDSPAKWVGFDADLRAVERARRAAQRCGLADWVRFEHKSVRELQSCDRPASDGVVVCNPPWGHRLGREAELATVYGELGTKLLELFAGWRCGVVLGDRRLGRSLGLHADRRYNLELGGIQCQFLAFQPSPEAAKRAAKAKAPAVIGEGGRAMANRIRKNLKKLAAWRKREKVECYRVYDADLPEYAVAVDVYGNQHIRVQEYAAPKTVDPNSARARLREAISVVAEVFELQPDEITLRRREKHQRGQQYQASGGGSQRIEIGEGPARFLVDFGAYLDTGLYLDHRITRRLVAERSRGRRLLNLFAYTGTATVLAALAGARATTSVDASRTYLDWMADNFRLNGLHANAHEIVRSDVLAWLELQRGPRFDIAFVDPPTFSNSKSSRRDFDVQRDHVELLQSVASCIAPGGEIVFSNHLRNFRLDSDALSGFEIEDWSAKTLPPDFARRPKIHCCYRIGVP